MNMFLYDAAWGSDIGKKRSENQDAVLFLPENGLFAVADGMGGLACGKEAAAEICRLLPKRLPLPEDGYSELDELADRVQDAVEQINQEICAMGNKPGSRPVYGSTLCGVLLCQKEAILFNVGDSRAYLLRKNLPVSRLTVDHSLAQVLLDNGEISEEESRSHPGRSRLTRFMGMSGRTNADVLRCPLLDGDQLLLCSDGLYNMVSENEMKAILLGPGPASNVCRSLIDHANQSGGQDNISVILLQFREKEANRLREEQQ